jgi:integrase
MPKPNTGQVLEHLWKDGKTITYMARVHAYGLRERVTLGTSTTGWNRVRAELELEKILQQVARGTWVPPRLEPAEDRAAAAMAELGIKVDESFRVFAARWWTSKRLRVQAATVSDYEWRLDYLRQFFGRYPLSEIDVAAVDRFRDELRDQAETIRSAAARGRPLTEKVTDRQGRTYQRRRRPLSNTSINAMIKLLGQILQQAVDYELIVRNPVRVGERGQRFLPSVKPVRSFLEVDEFEALLRAAGELDAEPANSTGTRIRAMKARGMTTSQIARKLDRSTQAVCYHLAREEPRPLGGRRAIIAALGLGGFRIGELGGLLVWQVDLARGRFKIADAKTDKGVREVEMTLFLRDVLVNYVADRAAAGAPAGPNDHFFGGMSGRRRSEARIRSGVLELSVQRANAARAKAGLAALPTLTPHSLRRTWATFAALAGRDQNWIADQIGHTTPHFTFSVYEQVHRRRFVDEQAIWELMRFADEPAERHSARQITRLSKASLRPRNRPTGEKSELHALLEDGSSTQN